ncbi:MAG: DoxX family protein [Chthoniobacterales bacterium]
MTDTTPSSKSPIRYVTIAARILLGLVFFVFGLNGFLHFIPQPPTMPEFATALFKTGYMFPLIAGTQVVSGALLLINRFVPLALALLAPLVVNILAFHVFLEPQGTVIAIVIVVLELYLAWAYRKAFCPMLAPKVTPH